MANFCIGDKWTEDPRRDLLIEKLGEMLADGLAFKLWRLAFVYFKRGEPVVPLHLFDVVPHSQAFVDVGLAERRPDGVYVRGSKDEFKWYSDGIDQRSEAGKVSAQRPRDEKGRLLPKRQPESNETPTKPNEIQPSSSSSSSSSPSSNEEKTGSKSSRPAYAARGADPIYKSAEELKAGLGAKKIAEWFTLYPDGRFLEEELVVVFQYYADRPDRIPGSRDAWVKACAFHMKHAWQQRKNLVARDGLMALMNAPPGQGGAGAKAAGVRGLLTGDDQDAIAETCP